MQIGWLLFSFRGRINRQKYMVAGAVILLATWMLKSIFSLPAVFAFSVDLFINKTLIAVIVGSMFGVVYFWIFLALTVKRLHDIDKSGWNQLWTLLPFIGWFMFIYWIYCKPGTHGRNRYGEDPLGNGLSTPITSTRTPIQTIQKPSSAVKIFKIVLLIGACLAGPYSLMLVIINNSDATKTAKSFISKNKQIRTEIGDVIGFGSWPYGVIFVTNGSGVANIKIHVDGTKGDAQASVNLTKDPGKEWEVKGVYVQKE